MKTTLKTYVTAAVGLCAAHAALADDAAAGAASFKKCAPCPDVDPAAKNKVGPLLNGLDNRRSGAIEGCSYSEANKKSGIVWNKETFLEYIKDSAHEDSRNQDGVRGHPQRNGSQKPVGLSRAIRPRRKAKVAANATLRAPCDRGVSSARRRFR